MSWWLPFGNLKNKMHKVHMNEDLNKILKTCSLGTNLLKKK